MKDALRSKLNLVLTTALAFAAGLGLAAALDLTPPSMAAGVQSVDLQIGTSSETAAELEEMTFRDGFAPIVDVISGAVVTIRVEKEVQRPRIQRFRLPSPFDEFFDRPRGEEPQEPRLQEGSGSGFVISEDGYIVTNNHVVEGAENITVQLPDRREISDVEVVGRDPQTDVALLKIDAEGLSAAPLGDSDGVQVGEWVLAIGSPGFDSPGGNTILESTVTAGIVSAKGRSIGILARGGQVPLAIESFIQTDAVINQGNSGGPLVNMRGEVVGMSTAIISETGTYQGYGFAVPTNLVRQVVEDLMEYGEVRRAVLGISIEDVGPADARYFGLEEIRGVEVADFAPLASGESPAQKAGMKRGDLILAVDGKPVQGVADLQTKIRGYSPGETVTLEVLREEDGDVRRTEIDVTLAAAETGEDESDRQTAGAVPEDPLGIDVEPVTPDLRRELELPDEVTGVVITDASRRSPLVRALGGLPNPTLVTSINGRDIGSVGEYRQVASGLEPGDLARVQLFLASPQTRQFSYVTVEIPGDGS